MPKKVERKLQAEARKHGFAPGSRRYGAYVYGTLAKLKKQRRRKKR